LLGTFVMRCAPVWRYDWRAGAFSTRATATEVAPPR
jgi:hypothetical protein